MYKSKPTTFFYECITRALRTHKLEQKKNDLNSVYIIHSERVYTGQVLWLKTKTICHFRQVNPVNGGW